eukprot:UN02578
MEYLLFLFFTTFVVGIIFYCTKNFL